MRKVAILLSLVFFASNVSGQSIFDDPPSKSPAASSSNPIAPRQPQVPSPQPSRLPPQPIVPQEPLEPPTEPIESVGKRAWQLESSAEAAAKEYLNRAQSEIETSLKSNSEYLRLKANSDTAKKYLEEIRVGGTGEQKISASTTYNQFTARERQFRDNAYASNPIYQDAKKLVDTFAISHAVAASGAEDSEKQKDIAAAIKRRDLLEGMTYEEACRAARKNGVLLSSSGNTRIYRWPISEQIGSHQVVKEQHQSLTGGGTRVEYATVADYAITGYVEADFTDGKLMGFRRINGR